jgi:TolA-binding protein
MSNTTLTQLEQQAADMQAKLDEMKATIESQRKAEESAKSNVFGMTYPVEGEQINYLGSMSGAGSLFVVGTFLFSGYISATNNPNTCFKDADKAAAMADAFNVLLELRTCEGVVEGEYNTCQFYIFCNKLGETWVSQLFGDSASLSPFFDSKANAEAAIDKIGKDRIKKAFLAMQGTF